MYVFVGFMRFPFIMMSVVRDERAAYITQQDALELFRGKGGLPLTLKADFLGKPLTFWADSFSLPTIWANGTI